MQEKEPPDNSLDVGIITKSGNSVDVDGHGVKKVKNLLPLAARHAEKYCRDEISIKSTRSVHRSDEYHLVTVLLVRS